MDKNQYGPWALVTGASSGIGEQFARRLANDGLDLILVARREQKLVELREQLIAAHGIECRIVVADLSTPHGVSEVIDKSADLEVGLLVNNAGHVVTGSFLGRDIDDYVDIIALNQVAPLRLSHAFGRKMASRGRGGILFVGSIAGFTGVPYMANYAGTKAYVMALAEGLRGELSEHGVQVSVLNPGFTDTEMAKYTTGMDMSRMPMPLMGVEQVVETGLRALPVKAVSIPGWMNRAMMFVMTKLLPRAASPWMFGIINRRALTPAAFDAHLPESPRRAALPSAIRSAAVGSAAIGSPTAGR